MSREYKYHVSVDCNGKNYIDGPNYKNNAHFSYHGGYLFGSSRFETEEAAGQCAALCNLAYNAGYAAAKAELRQWLQED